MLRKRAKKRNRETLREHSPGRVTKSTELDERLMLLHWKGPKKAPEEGRLSGKTARQHRPMAGEIHHPILIRRESRNEPKEME